MHQALPFGEAVCSPVSPHCVVRLPYSLLAPCVSLSLAVCRHLLPLTIKATSVEGDCFYALSRLGQFSVQQYDHDPASDLPTRDNSLSPLTHGTPCRRIWLIRGQRIPQ